MLQDIYWFIIQSGVATEYIRGQIVVCVLTYLWQIKCGHKKTQKNKQMSTFKSGLYEVRIYIYIYSGDLL